MKWGAAGAVLLIAVAGCGGKPDGCVTLDDSVAQAVIAGGKSDLELRPATGQAILAESGVYYAAYQIVAAGSEEVGVWALEEIAPPGAVRSVNGYATEFTNWPELPGANGSDDARDAEACLD